MINDRNCIGIIFNTLDECNLFYIKLKMISTDNNIINNLKLYINSYYGLFNNNYITESFINFKFILLYNRNENKIILTILSAEIKDRISEFIMYDNIELFLNNMKRQPDYRPKTLIYD